MWQPGWEGCLGENSEWKSLSHVQLCDFLQARILEWVAFPFSRGSSQPRDWTQVSRIAGRFFFYFCRQILYQLSHKGSPRILEWVAYPFSRRFSWPRNQTGVSCIAGGFSTNWAMREAHCGENGYMYMYGWVRSLFTWDYHNTGYTPTKNKKLFKKITVPRSPYKSQWLIHRQIQRQNITNHDYNVYKLHM